MCLRPSTSLLGNLQIGNVLKWVNKKWQIHWNCCGDLKLVVDRRKQRTQESSTEEILWQACCAALGTHQRSGRQTGVQSGTPLICVQHMSITKRNHIKGIISWTKPPESLYNPIWLEFSAYRKDFNWLAVVSWLVCYCRLGVLFPRKQTLLTR